MKQGHAWAHLCEALVLSSFALSGIAVVHSTAGLWSIVSAIGCLILLAIVTPYMPRQLKTPFLITLTLSAMVLMVISVGPCLQSLFCPILGSLYIRRFRRLDSTEELSEEIANRFKIESFVVPFVMLMLQLIRNFSGKVLLSSVYSVDVNPVSFWYSDGWMGVGLIVFLVTRLIAIQLVKPPRSNMGLTILRFCLPALGLCALLLLFIPPHITQGFTIDGATLDNEEKPLSYANLPHPTMQWWWEIVTALIVCGVALWFILRRQKVDVPPTLEDDHIMDIQRNKWIVPRRGVQFLPTNSPIRLQYQQFIQRTVQDGSEAIPSETPCRFLQRVGIAGLASMEFLKKFLPDYLSARYNNDRR